MVQTRSSTRTSLSDSEQGHPDNSQHNTETDNNNSNNTQEDVKQDQDTNDIGLSEVAKGKRPVKRKQSDEPEPEETATKKKKKRTPRGGQRKTHVYHIPVPKPNELEVIRNSFVRPNERQVWGVIRDHFCALEHFWAHYYGWNLPTTKVEMDYGLLVRTIAQYRNLPHVDGKNCDRCAARGQTSMCHHNSRDACKSCVRNSATCTVTDRREKITVILKGRGNAGIDLSDPLAKVEYWSRDQQPPLPMKPEEDDGYDDDFDDQVREHRAATPGPSTEVYHESFVPRRRGNPVIKHARQPRFDRQDPRDYFGNSPYTDAASLNTHFDQEAFRFQQGLSMAAQNQYPVPSDPTAFSTHLPQYDLGNSGSGLQGELPGNMPTNYESLIVHFKELQRQVAQLSHDRDLMMNEITRLRDEVQKLGGASGTGTDPIGLTPFHRAPANFEGPASFPVQQQPQFDDITQGSLSNTVTPTSPLFEHPLQNSTATSAAFEHNTQNQTATALFQPSLHQTTPTSAGFPNSTSHPTPTQPLFPSQLSNPSDFEFQSGYNGLATGNPQQYEQQLSQAAVDPEIVNYSGLSSAAATNALHNSQMGSYDISATASSLLPPAPRRETIRRQRRSTVAAPGAIGNGAVGNGGARDTSLRSTNDRRLGGHFIDVMREVDRRASQGFLEEDWPPGTALQFGSNVGANNEVPPTLHDQSRHGSLAVDPLDGFDGNLYNLPGDAQF